MKQLLFVVLVAAFGAAFAEEAKPDVQQMAPGRGRVPVHSKPLNRKLVRQQLYLRNGPKLSVPGAAQGKVVYVNAAKDKVPNKWLEENAEVFRQGTDVIIEVAEGTFEFPNPKLIGTASLFVVDDEKMPPMLVAPESKWCMINIAPLAKGEGAKPQFFSARVQKELTRGFAMLAGAPSSNFPNSMMSGITNPEDLDKFPTCQLPVDVTARFRGYLAGYGIRPDVKVYYRKACEEGWAPQPTNDVERAVWSDVHKLPSEPIKIKYDPKRDK